jgi:hypothetical protein
MNETPLEDNQESFLGLMECFGTKKPDKTEFHPLNFKQLLRCKKDKIIIKILAMENAKYKLHDFHGGGKTTFLICYRNTIVVPRRLQKAVLAWYHKTLCHPE